MCSLGWNTRKRRPPPLKRAITPEFVYSLNLSQDSIVEFLNIFSPNKVVVMSASSFAVAISIEPSQIPNPPPVYSKTHTRDAFPRETDPPLDLEMLPISLIEPSSSIHANTSLKKLPLRSSDKHPHSSASPPGHASEQIQTIWDPYKNRFRVLASCMAVVSNGMNDSAPGALIASIERYVSHLANPKNGKLKSLIETII